MPSTSETGHAKNVANLQQLITTITSFGTNYNPVKTTLKLANLTTLYTTASTNLTDVITRNTAYNNSVNLRVQAFSNVKPLATRLYNALQTTDATQEKINDAKVFNRKLQGKRASTPITPADPNTPPPDTISTSQQSYDQQIQHLAGLVSVLITETSYTPNETDLKTTTIQAKITDLTAKNLGVLTAYTAVSNARILRDKTLYKDDTGLFDIAEEVKKYVKSVFGATSPEFKQVKGIKFTAKKK